MKYRQIGKARRRARLREKDGVLGQRTIRKLLKLDLETGRYNNPRYFEEQNES